MKTLYCFLFCILFGIYTHAQSSNTFDQIQEILNPLGGKSSSLDESDLKNRADKGDSFDKYYLGLFYLEKINKTKSTGEQIFFLKEALKWLQVAAEQEHAEAQYKLGEMNEYPYYWNFTILEEFG